MEKVTIRYSLPDFSPENAGMQIVPIREVESAVAKLRREGWTIRAVRPTTKADIDNVAYRLTL